MPSALQAAHIHEGLFHISPSRLPKWHSCNRIVPSLQNLHCGTFAANWKHHPVPECCMCRLRKEHEQVFQARSASFLRLRLSTALQEQQSDNPRLHQWKSALRLCIRSPRSLAGYANPRLLDIHRHPVPKGCCLCGLFGNCVGLGLQSVQRSDIGKPLTTHVPRIDPQPSHTDTDLDHHKLSHTLVRVLDSMKSRSIRYRSPQSAHGARTNQHQRHIAERPQKFQDSSAGMDLQAKVKW